MRIAIFVLIILFPILLKADGTFYLSDIEPLLKQQPELWASIKAGFDIQDVGIAPRIGLLVNKKLHGMRIAPYTLDAKPKGSKGPFIFEIEIRAKTHFYDAKGKEVAIEDAVDLKEELESVIIRKMSQADIETEIKFQKQAGK